MTELKFNLLLKLVQDSFTIDSILREDEDYSASDLTISLKNAITNKHYDELTEAQIRTIYDL